MLPKTHACLHPTLKYLSLGEKGISNISFASIQH